MATMRQIRSRIRVARSIQQITKAMKMVAAARLKRAQDRVQSSRPYAARMRDVVGRMTGSAVGHPLTEEREGGRTALLVITADRGLCGSYNGAMLRFVVEYARQFDPALLDLHVIGKKGNQFLKRRGFNVVSSPELDTNGVPFSQAVSIANELRRIFESGAVNHVHLVFTRFISPITQRPTGLRVLPIEATETDGAQSDCIFEPSAESLTSELLPRYLTTQVYQALLESVASEHGARMTSMTSATDNAGKMISDLTLALNRARQSSITKEISEIVGGAEALKG